MQASARFVVVGAFCLGTSWLGCSGHPPRPASPTDDTGHHGAAPVHLVISCSASTQARFDEALVLLHNMEYLRARERFNAASEAEPSCAMLQWGVAMTYFHPLWPGEPSADDVRSGRAAVTKGQAASQANDIERAYLAAVAEFYRGDDTAYPGRLASWAAAQAKVAEQAPADVEAQAFSALAALANVDKQDKAKSRAQREAIGAKLEALLQQHPDHPGLMHYLLHAYDFPGLAQHALEVARRYAASSPDASHALHMPGHIYVRLGAWTDVVQSNIDSAAAAQRHPNADGRISRHYLHAADYMIYGYLQMGDDEHAREIVAKLAPSSSFELHSGPGAYALAAGPARMALERGMWKDAAALAPRAVPYDWEDFPWAEAVTYAARGLGAARAGDPKLAQQQLLELERLTPQIKAAWWKGRVEIEHDAIAAWVAHDLGDDKQAEQLARKASERELAAGKDGVEPGHVFYATEVLGDLLLELKRPADALDAFQATLEDSPQRLDALYGAGQAAELAGKPDVAATYYRQLVAISPASSRPAREHAQQFLAQHR